MTYETNALSNYAQHRKTVDGLIEAYGVSGLLGMMVDVANNRLDEVCREGAQAKAWRTVAASLYASIDRINSIKTWG